MKKVVTIIAAIALLTSCGKGDRGQLVGVRGHDWHPVKPFGMVLVPGGSFVMGKASLDVAGLHNAPTQTVTVRSFYMDETEITNSEYRQFVYWVRDSVIRQKLAEEASYASGGDGGTDNGGGKNATSIQDYAFLGAAQDEEDKTAFQKYSKHYNPTDQFLNWNVPIIWDPNKWPDKHYVFAMDNFYLPDSASLDKSLMFDVSKIVYSYKTMDIGQAARVGEKRSNMVEEHEVPVYPDTTVWVKDFSYSYNEPMHNNYFSHAAYDDYPVVGVSWEQAKAFCHWRTAYHNAYRHEKDLENVPNYRLPSEAEWEYAARGGLDGANYPWGGPYTKNAKGCFLANFKPMRGDYAADQALYTVEAKSYQPNGFGLYNMAGNVAEWCNSSYDRASYQFYSSMNPNANDEENMRKVVRGGSWKDVAYYLQVGSRDFEYADSARSYIGFRTVQDYIGTDKQVVQRTPQ